MARSPKKGRKMNGTNALSEKGSAPKKLKGNLKNQKKKEKSKVQGLEEF